MAALSLGVNSRNSKVVSVVGLVSMALLAFRICPANLRN